jgi:hypothetical protein
MIKTEDYGLKAIALAIVSQVVFRSTVFAFHPDKSVIQIFTIHIPVNDLLVTGTIKSM